MTYNVLSGTLSLYTTTTTLGLLFTIARRVLMCFGVQNQSSVNLLVPDGTDSQFFVFIIVALVLKLIHLLHLIIRQVHGLHSLAKAPHDFEKVTLITPQTEFEMLTVGIVTF